MSQSKVVAHGGGSKIYMKVSQNNIGGNKARSLPKPLNPFLPC